MSSTTNAHVTIDLCDVVRSGSVEQAIINWAEESQETSSGIVGPSFSTSGPGYGWSVQHGADDYAARAFDGGAMYYVDESDGRLAREVSGTEWGTSEWSPKADWSDDSVVCVECPSIEDAIEHPTKVAEMALSVIDRHGACSDRKAWADLVRKIKAAAHELGEIDPSDLDD